MARGIPEVSTLDQQKLARMQQVEPKPEKSFDLDQPDPIPLPYRGIGKRLKVYPVDQVTLGWLEVAVNSLNP
jgi:hypothetical protein